MLHIHRVPLSVVKKKKEHVLSLHLSSRFAAKSKQTRTTLSKLIGTNKNKRFDSSLEYNYVPKTNKQQQSFFILSVQEWWHFFQVCLKRPPFHSSPKSQKVTTSILYTLWIILKLGT